jgi:peptidyl-tRNA hydrolase
LRVNLDIALWQQAFGQGPKFAVDCRRAGKAGDAELSAQHPLDVAVENRRPPAKGKGSDGGHNGLKNIQLLLNSTEYPRFRFGISDQFKKGQQVDYVLGEWDEEEKVKLPERYEVAKQIIESFALAGLNNTMNSFNGK